MNLQTAKLILTQCWKCLGCNRLEDLTFAGDNKCKEFRSAENEVE